MNPHQVSYLEIDFLFALVCLLCGLIIGLSNPFPHLSIQVLNLLGPLLDLPTEFSGMWNGSEIQWAP